QSLATETEDFLWDGLALIQRGSERFINEPHVGNAPKKLCFEGKPRAQRSARRARKGPRGNPVVSSKGTSYFNDMLGTTLGAKTKGKKYSAAALTAFGESLPPDTSNLQLKTHNSQTFYTGKPLVAGLGHAFLFRNYRASLARWHTADPLGYPDGWNRLAYCNNGVTHGIDYLGAEIVVIICSDTRAPGTCGVGDGHSWVVFYNTDTQTRTTVGTWGNLDPEGQHVNREDGLVPEVCRGRIMSDDREKDVADVLREYRDLGEDAWSYTEPCSDFAIAIWKAATGEDLSTGLVFDTPTDLKNKILEMNGGKQCPCIKYLE
ncbi:MAG: hypothetical protein IKD78_08010, partial [Bacteroidales bacterium]|nr:hypothetical protein [Bacteroidales bacterium]